MNSIELPDDWTEQRETLRRVTTHVIARAQQDTTGHFALTATAGGFGTPQLGEQRKRVRVVGGHVVVENADGVRNGEAAATTTSLAISGSTISELCSLCGTTPDPELSVGGDTPELGNPDEALAVEARAGLLLGDWYGLGQRAMDTVLLERPGAAPSVIRLWPEHFDLGVDLAVGSGDGDRVNLGSAAGDSFSEEPYVYVGPWSEGRPGPADFWNAPFGAVKSYAEVMASDDPVEFVAGLFRQGLDLLSK